MYPTKKKANTLDDATRTMSSGGGPSGSAPATYVNLLILVTGSVAAVNTGLLLDQLASEHCRVRIAATKTAFHFLTRAKPSATAIPLEQILTDETEWSEWQAMNDAVVHIELRKWADLVVIAPLDANTLAKVANGLCDNLVTCVMRAWEVGAKPVVLCPAMNTAMWTHPITAKQIDELRGWYSPAEETSGDGGSPNSTRKQRAAHLFQIVGPVSKKLACGDIGVGGMAPVEEIAAAVRTTMAEIRQQKAASSSASSANR